MKKIMTFLIIITSVLLVAGGLTACSSNSKSAKGFTFSYQTNSAQKQTISEQNYVVIMLDVKNDNKENNTLIANKFKLVQDGKDISSEVYFGNNIIDQMPEETLEANDSEQIHIMLKVDSQTSGQMKLVYDQIELFNIRV